MLISLIDLINKYNLTIKGIIHIGAHYGQEYSSYVENNIKNLIFFEPLKNNYQALLNNIQLSDTVKAYNIALGNTVGQIEMFVETANQGMSSSILEPVIHLKQYPSITFNNKEMVNIDRLDNITFNKEDFNMINIDVQGYELEVFRGATDTLNHIDLIYGEVNREELYKNCTQVDELDAFLGTFGFKRSITVWNGVTFGDAVYLKNDNNEKIIEIG